MNALQRDFGRVETKVEVLTEDMKAVKKDLEEIKEILQTRKAVKESDWKRLSVIAVLASIATHIFNWVRPFIS